MSENAISIPEKPAVRPQDARFSSGPCKKYPGWQLSDLTTEHLGRSHRAKQPKQHIQSSIERSHALLGLPEDWKLGIVPGSDTGAFEMAMWSMLGQRPVDALVWDSFSGDWAKDLALLDLPALNVYEADYGELPELTQTNSNHDIVMVYNGTTSGVRVPDLDWIADDREGLVLCDSTSAAYAMPMDFSKLDVVTWSWQKVLGGEGAHGMLALSPRAVERLESFTPGHPLPKVFRLTKQQSLDAGIFSGSTINTPSLLAIADLHAALDWAESIGGREALWQRTQANFDCIDNWVQKTDWIDWLAENPAIRSPTSMCLQIADPAFNQLDKDTQQKAITRITGWLEEEGVALDIKNYRSAPAGFRIWGGATIETDDLAALTHWLDWAFARFTHEMNAG
ncbi:MAG: Phosphoserine aminotransferase (EC [uncultured Thiotrichaceae bacterium]|uniref:phosphoserine transaminase n=1 Tax=uncultured Thiotrichaceae bacterium TaxID=298394 RepID=A0A6S6T9M4_9GAMM|nr:MAG: Phosphoserine aminotransferase (EC [uncultured Thiotrichaceae bacterium]